MTHAIGGPRLRPPTPLERNLVFGTIGATIVLGWIGDALWASLFDRHPLTLILLNAKPRYLVLTVNQLDAWTYYLVGTTRLWPRKNARTFMSSTAAIRVRRSGMHGSLPA